MKIIVEENYTRIVADEGKILYNENADVYSYDVILGKLDSPSNWQEIDDIQPEEEKE